MASTTSAYVCRSNVQLWKNLAIWGPMSDLPLARCFCPFGELAEVACDKDIDVGGHDGTLSETLLVFVSVSLHISTKRLCPYSLVLVAVH